MKMTNLRKCLVTLLAGGCLYAQTSCIPNKEQWNAMINSALLNGVQIAITLAIEQALTPNLDIGDDAVVVVETTETPQ